MKLGSWEEIEEISTDFEFWDDLQDGLLTVDDAKIIKFYLDQLSDNDEVYIEEKLAASGKTSAFVLKNTDKNIFTVTSDIYESGAMFVYCEEFFEYHEEDPRAFKFDLSGKSEIVFDEAGDMTKIIIKENIHDNRPQFEHDYSKPAPEWTVEELQKWKFSIHKSEPFNVNGQSLWDFREETGVGNKNKFMKPKLQIISPFPALLGPDDWEKNNLMMNYAAACNRCPVGGIIIITNYQYNFIGPHWYPVVEAIREDGRQFEQIYLNYSEPNKEGHWRTSAIKRFR